MKAGIPTISIIFWFVIGISHLYAGPIEVWHNTHTGITIYTEYFNNGMEVKGLYQKNNIAWFKRQRNNVFKDNKGNSIRLINDQLVFSDRRNRAKLTFLSIPQQHTSTVQNPDLNSDSNKQHSSTIQDNKTTIKPSSVSKKSDKEIIPIKDINHDKMEGTWAVKGMDKKVFITETREGIKARFTDELNWFTYTQVEGSFTFINENEAYYIKENDALIWKDKTGKTFSLYKTSDTLED